MFFRDEKPRAAAGLPLRRVLDLLGRTIKLNSLSRRRGTFRRRRSLVRSQLVPELHGAPPNGNRGNKKKDARHDKHDTIMMCPNPIHLLKCKPQHLDPGQDFDVLVANDEIQRGAARLI